MRDWEAVPPHGGGLLAAEAAFGRPRLGWLDLSTGIAPWPFPLPRLPSAAWRRLPEPEEAILLERVAAEAYGVADSAHVVAAPGAQALIQWLPRLCRPGPVAVVGFTYAEHARSWHLAGHAVASVQGLEDVADSAIVVLANPNNPDGRIVGRDILLAMAERLAARNGLLVVDEAFADAMPDVSVADAVGRPGLCVLRSFGKMYGLAGLRLGFALASPPLVQDLRTALGPWAVSGAAIAVGRQALADIAWRRAAIAKLTAASARLDRVLTGAGLRVLGGTPLFRLVSVEGAAAALRAHLARDGILTRAFAERPDWLRVGLPGSRSAERRLAASLRQARTGGILA